MYVVEILKLLRKKPELFWQRGEILKLREASWHVYRSCERQRGGDIEVAGGNIADIEVARGSIEMFAL
jgi:hypothetical protein